MYNQRNILVLAAVLLVGLSCCSVVLVKAFSFQSTPCNSRPSFILQAAASQSAAAATAPVTKQESFIDTQLRGEAMRLHTREQAPKEGQAPSPKQKPGAKRYTPTHEDYLRFLVDSQYVYQVFEDIVNEKEELAAFRNTGLERTVPLETDILFMMKEYQLERPKVGAAGKEYGELLKCLQSSIPEFVCHFYNFYFAHTAGGRMIGKQMSALLLDKRTLEFYKWDGDLNEIKARVKGTIEDMAASWSDEERNACVGETAAAFQVGGAINGYLMGGAPH